MRELRRGRKFSNVGLSLTEIDEAPRARLVSFGFLPVLTCDEDLVRVLDNVRPN